MAECILEGPSIIFNQDKTHYTGTIYGNASDYLTKDSWRTYTYAGAPVYNPSGVTSSYVKGGTISVVIQGSLDAAGTNWITLGSTFMWGDSEWGAQSNNEAWSTPAEYKDTPIYQIRYTFSASATSYWARWCYVSAWDIITTTSINVNRSLVAD